TTIGSSKPMRKRQLLITLTGFGLGLILMLLLVWLVVYRPSHPQGNGDRQAQVTAADDIPQVTAPKGISRHPVPSNNVRQEIQPDPRPDASSTTSAEEVLRQMNEHSRQLLLRRAEEFKNPISFFGRVLDEKSNSVAGVQVALQWTDTSPQG